MRTIFADLWDKLRTSLWFIPALMAAGSVVLAFVLVRAQRWVTDEIMYETRWLATGDPDGARQILATIAGSIITVTGVIFSVTIVALSLASQQFGPRLLRNFMRDRGNQFVLGTFIGTFLYAILVLRVVQEDNGEANIPYLAVTFAVLLAMFSLAVLIYFIHHVVVSIQADSVIATVTHELHSTMSHMFPKEEGAGAATNDAEHDAARDDFGSVETAVTADRSGYVRALDHEWLLDVAEEHDVIVYITARPGRFVIKGLELATIYSQRPLERPKREAIARHVRRSVLMGQARTSEQDIEFSIAQLVEIAVRSLSPSVNDPFTAMACLDRLGEAMCELGDRPLPKQQRCFRNGRLGLIIDRPDFAGMVNLAFDQIRQNARGKPAVMIRMLEVIGMIIERLGGRPACFKSLLAQATMVARNVEQAVEEESDRAAIAERLNAAVQRAQQ